MLKKCLLNEQMRDLVYVGGGSCFSLGLTFPICKMRELDSLISWVLATPRFSNSAGRGCVEPPAGPQLPHLRNRLGWRPESNLWLVEGRFKLSCRTPLLQVVAGSATWRCASMTPSPCYGTLLCLSLPGSHRAHIPGNLSFLHLCPLQTTQLVTSILDVLKGWTHCPCEGFSKVAG